MEVAKQVASATRGSLGRAFVVVTLAVCVYQVWRRWRDRSAVERKIRGKVVLITGASSGLGEGWVMIHVSMKCYVV